MHLTSPLAPLALRVAHVVTGRQRCLTGTTLKIGKVHEVLTIYVVADWSWHINRIVESIGHSDVLRNRYESGESGGTEVHFGVLTKNAIEKTAVILFTYSVTFDKLSPAGRPCQVYMDPQA